MGTSLGDLWLVMPAPVAGILGLNYESNQRPEGRDKPGHDVVCVPIVAKIGIRAAVDAQPSDAGSPVTGPCVILELGDPAA